MDTAATAAPVFLPQAEAILLSWFIRDQAFLPLALDCLPGKALCWVPFRLIPH